MVSEPLMRRYRNCYAKLLRLYPKPYRERFGEAMEQTFSDLCRERVKAERGLFGFALWIFLETSAGILRENATIVMRCCVNRGSTMFLRVVISLIAIAALSVCIFPLPRMVAQEAAKTPDTAYLVYLFLMGAYVTAVLFFVAVYQAFKLLTYVDGNKAFSEISVKALRHIKHSAITISLLTVAGIAAVMVLSVGKGEDIAGIVAAGLMMTFVSSVFAAFLRLSFKSRCRRPLTCKKKRLYEMESNIRDLVGTAFYGSEILVGKGVRPTEVLADVQLCS